VKAARAKINEALELASALASMIVGLAIGAAGFFAFLILIKAVLLGGR
jgi:hypothetical protein